LSNLKQIAVGLKQYQNDFDRRCPLIAVANRSSADYLPPYGWADALQPYLRNTEIYQCPSDEHEGIEQSHKSGFTDYWINRNVAGREFPGGYPPPPLHEKIITFGDGNGKGDLTNARYNLPALPAVWLKDYTSPAYRHSDGANYAFLDGHVKWLRPNKISTGPVAQNQYTFSPK
jgi:prepilin-type processing-associated H-X9-DG protein